MAFFTLQGIGQPCTPRARIRRLSATAESGLLVAGFSLILKTAVRMQQSVVILVDQGGDLFARDKPPRHTASVWGTWLTFLQGVLRSAKCYAVKKGPSSKIPCLKRVTWKKTAEMVVMGPLSSWEVRRRRRRSQSRSSENFLRLTDKLISFFLAFCQDMSTPFLGLHRSSSLSLSL